MLTAEIQQLSDDEFFKRLSIAFDGSIEHAQLMGDLARRQSVWAMRSTERDRLLTLALVTVGAIAGLGAVWPYLASWFTLHVLGK